MRQDIHGMCDYKRLYKRLKTWEVFQGKFMPNVIEVYTMVKYFKANLLNKMITIGS